MEYVFEKKVEVTIDVDFKRLYDLIKEEEGLTDSDDICNEFGDNQEYYLGKLFSDTGIDFSDEDHEWALDDMWKEFGKWLDNNNKNE